MKLTAIIKGLAGELRQEFKFLDTSPLFLVIQDLQDLHGRKNLKFFVKKI